MSSWLAEQVERMRRGDDHYEIAMTSTLAREAALDGVDRRPQTDSGKGCATGLVLVDVDA